MYIFLIVIIFRIASLNDKQAYLAVSGLLGSDCSLCAEHQVEPPEEEAFLNIWSWIWKVSACCPCAACASVCQPR